MPCPRCQAQNDENARFCEDCGARLELACPRCGQSATPGKKFCRSCGAPLTDGPPEATSPSPQAYTPKHLAEKILSAKFTLEGERKQVTVLFADLKGSLELIAERDPEEAHALLDPVLERMMEAVHRYEGTVNQVMGDGIMALFGAPVAHEDHALRACYAALRMQEQVQRYAGDARRAHGVNVQIRVGINSGEVVVRTIASDLRMDYTAVGQTTHLAARMEQLASPGSILLTPSTLELVEGFVAVKPLGPVPVKGLAGLVEVFELTGVGPARTRLQAAARRGLTRLVGRAAELEQLHRVQHLAGTGHGQVAAIVGEAGVGKSRLVYEFTHSHRLQGWFTLEAASVSYGKATSYLPVIDLLRGYFKIQERNDLRDIREKVTGTLLTLDRALEPMLPALLALLDVPVDDATWTALDPGQRRHRTLDAVKRLLLREARERPLLLVFEDLHWIDGETQAVLDTLVESLGSARLLLLVNYRPEYQHTWGSKTAYSQLRLDTLSAGSAGELLDVLLGGDFGLAPLKQFLVKRGNPFFLEETVRTLVESKTLAGEHGRYRLTHPIHAIQIPATVQGVLAARIDRLAPEDKRLLQVASVVGKDVPFALLQAIAELPDEALRQGLDHLQAAEFLYEAGLYPDLECSFHHALTHEVAYGQIVAPRRKLLHRRVAEALATLHAASLESHHLPLGLHYAEGEVWDKAVVHLRRAGARALQRSANREAVACFERALDALAHLQDTQSTLEQAFDIRSELHSAFVQLGEVDHMLECLREREALVERLNDDHRRGLVCVSAAAIYMHLGRLDEAHTYGTRALEIALVREDLDLRIHTATILVQGHFRRAEYEQAVRLATDNLVALPAERAYEHFGNIALPSVADRGWLTMSLAELGRFAEANEYAAEAIRLAESARHPYTLAVAHRGAGWFHLLKGNWVNARALIEREIGMLRTANIALLLPHAVACLAWLLAQLGDASEGLNRLRVGEQLLERQQAEGVVGHRGWVQHALGRACLLLGRLDEAQDFGDRVVETAPQHPGFAAHALHLLGDIATHRERLDPETGEAHYHHALALAEASGMRPLVAHCHLGLGKLYGRTGKRDQTREHLATALAMYHEMEMAFWLAHAQAEMTNAVA